MRTNRRNFIRLVGAASLAATVPEAACKPSIPAGRSGRLSLSFMPYELQLRHTFTVSGNSRNTTPVVLTEIAFEGITGYGGGFDAPVPWRIAGVGDPFP